MQYDLINKLIAKNKEGEYWDFKEVWHKDNEKLIHDILCFANTVHYNDCYIIIGVADDFDIVGVGEDDDNRKNQNDLIDLVNGLSFSGGSIPRVLVDSLIIENKIVDVVTIKNSDETPYFLSRTNNKHRKLKAGVVYSRHGDRNTPINVGADFSTVEKLWKKRFGLLIPKLEMFLKHLKLKHEWTRFEQSYYNIHFPDMRMDMIDIDEELEPVFYVYNQTNSRHLYKSIKIVHNTTLLDEFQLIYLDSGRYLTTTPKSGFINYDFRNVNHYKYFVLESLNYVIHRFLFNDESHEAKWAKGKFDEVVLYFDDELERESFESFVSKNKELYDVIFNKYEDEYYDIDINDARRAQIYKMELVNAKVFNEMLHEYRENVR
jgi:hypothetical protein